MYGTLPIASRLTRMACAHLQPHIFSGHQEDGTKIDTCPRCRAQWVIGPSGARTRVRWGD